MPFFFLMMFKITKKVNTEYIVLVVVTLKWLQMDEGYIESVCIIFWAWKFCTEALQIICFYSIYIRNQQNIWHIRLYTKYGNLLKGRLWWCSSLQHSSKSPLKKTSKCLVLLVQCPYESLQHRWLNDWMTF